MEPKSCLFFNGNILETMTHYAQTPGGRINAVFRNRDALDAQERMSGGGDLSMKMAMSLSDATVMASKNSDGIYHDAQGFHVLIAETSRAEFDRVCDALLQDTQSAAMAPQETFWSKRSPIFVNRHDTPWMLSYNGGSAQGGQP